MRNKVFLLLITFFSIQAPYYSKEITIKEGDTLSKIADEYQVTVRSIMDSNQIYDGDKLKVGDKILLPDNAIVTNSRIKYKVMPGDTLEKIASLYSIDKDEIITLNNIEKPNILALDQILFLPKNAKISNPKSASKNPVYHIIKEGETIYQLSKKYNISVDDIIDINSLKDPSSISSGYKLKLTKNSISESIKTSVDVGKNTNLRNKYSSSYVQKNTNNSSDLRYFGPFKIEWSSWRKINGSYITPANKNGRNLFLAVNCRTSKINLSKRNGNWSKWLAPEKYYEYNLLDERCENAS